MFHTSDDDEVAVEIQEAIDRLEQKLVNLMKNEGETASVKMESESSRPPSSVVSGNVTTRDITLEQEEEETPKGTSNDMFYMVMMYLINVMADWFVVTCFSLWCHGMDIFRVTGPLWG